MQKLALALFLFAFVVFLSGCAGCHKPIEYPYTYVVDHECTLVDVPPSSCTIVGNCGR